jgi:hypothetical protein
MKSIAFGVRPISTNIRCGIFEVPVPELSIARIKVDLREMTDALAPPTRENVGCSGKTGSGRLIAKTALMAQSGSRLALSRPGHGPQKGGHMQR